MLQNRQSCFVNFFLGVERMSRPALRAKWCFNIRKDKMLFFYSKDGIGDTEWDGIVDATVGRSHSDTFED